MYIGDRLVNGVAPKDRNISMVFQSYALYPHMNVFDNIAFPLKIRHVNKDEIKKRAKDVADTLKSVACSNENPKSSAVDRGNVSLLVERS